MRASELRIVYRGARRGKNFFARRKIFAENMLH
jgi:hypothetical protein